MRARVILALTALVSLVGAGLSSPVQVQAQAQASPQEVVRRFVQAVHKGEAETVFALSAQGAAKVEGRAAFEVKRAREEFQLALGGDPSLCPPDSNISLSCRNRTFRGDRVTTDTRLFIPPGARWEVADEPAPPPGRSTARVTVKVAYSAQGGLSRVRDLRGLVGPGAGVRPPIPPIYGDGWITPDNPLYADTRTKSADYKFFIQYQRQEVRSGEVVFQLYKEKNGWLVEGLEFVESKAVLGEAVKVDTSKK